MLGVLVPSRLGILGPQHLSLGLVGRLAREVMGAQVGGGVLLCSGGVVIMMTTIHI